MWNVILLFAMATQCVLTMDMDRKNSPFNECPFDRKTKDKGSCCPWRNEKNLCCFKADRSDLMKSLSLLSTRVFEMSKHNALPTETITDACLLLNNVRSLMEKRS